MTVQRGKVEVFVVLGCGKARVCAASFKVVKFLLGWRPRSRKWSTRTLVFEG